jgi:hypothetical protein
MATVSQIIKDEILYRRVEGNAWALSARFALVFLAGLYFERIVGTVERVVEGLALLFG